MTDGRRAFLKASAAGAAGLALSSGCAHKLFTVAPPSTRRRFARVDVSEDRVIRTVAGLRPFRSEGFVLRAERAGDKLLVHDYGHGGGGVTLSWGTAQLAADEISSWAGAKDRCAVIGAGAVGLATARTLQRRGHDVTIYARELPPATTSNVAGAQWHPFAVHDVGMTTRAFDDQFARATRISWRLFQDLPGTTYGIRWIENYELSAAPFPEPPHRDLYVDAEDLGPGQHPFPVPYARRFTTMLVETSVYLEAMLREFRIAGGRVVVRELTSPEDLLALPEPVLFNCTGLGSRELLGDRRLIPIKGQLAVLLPQPEVDYVVVPGGGLYMFPRRDGILLGGSFERGVETLEPDPGVTRGILDGHRRFFEGMR